MKRFRFTPRVAASLVATAMAFPFATGAQAHNQFLLPSITVLSKAQVVTFDGAVSTHLFDIDFVPLNTDGLTITAPDGSAATPENLARMKLRSVFDVDVAMPGTYRIAVVSNSVFASYKDAAGQQKRWRGNREGLARAIPADATELRVTEGVGRVETFVTLGKPTLLKPVRQGLEMLPVTAVTDLARGESAGFALMLDGKPAADVEVTVVRGGQRWRDQVGEIKVRTDAAGRFDITWPEAGLYYLEASMKDDKTTVPQARERRLNYSATLEVLP